MPFRLSSPVFQSGDAIPTRYTCDGENISPPLRWSQPPQDTQSLVLIMDDPDAPSGTFTHWILFNIPPDTNELIENFSRDTGGIPQGRNDFKNDRYDGPCPPADTTHSYYLRLYAINRRLDLEEGAVRIRVYAQMQGYVLANSELMAMYTRQEAKAAR
jgi:Raf kinase inhibitor-like YbhB/YbcL family protein